MKLGEFIEKFSHNNTIRLLYKHEGGHEVVLDDWNDVSMDHEITNGKGKFRHYINNEVLGLATISFSPRSEVYYTEAINIVIERIENQLFIEEKTRVFGQKNDIIFWSDKPIQVGHPKYKKIKLKVMNLINYFRNVFTKKIF